MPRKTKTQWIKGFRSVHGDKYCYNKYINSNEYFGSRYKLTITCPIHGDFRMEASTHKRGQGCPCCGRKLASSKNTKSVEENIKQFKEVHGDRYDYSKYTETVPYAEGITIICSKHGEFKQTVNTHKKGNGCNACGYDKMADERIMSVEDRIKQFNEIHNNKYTYDKFTEPTPTTKKITITCPAHGDFEQQVNRHQQGQGCPKCKTSKGEREVSQWLDDNKFVYAEQFRFKGTEVDRLIFDFFIPNAQGGICIEYNGIQHYKPVEHFGGQKTFDRQVAYDKRKADFCNRIGADLIVIRYDEDVNEVLTNYFKSKGG